MGEGFTLTKGGRYFDGYVFWVVSKILTFIEFNLPEIKNREADATRFFILVCRFTSINFSPGKLKPHTEMEYTSILSSRAVSGIIKTSYNIGVDNKLISIASRPHGMLEGYSGVPGFSKVLQVLHSYQRLYNSEYYFQGDYQ